MQLQSPAKQEQSSNSPSNSSSSSNSSVSHSSPSQKNINQVRSYNKMMPFVKDTHIQRIVKNNRLRESIGVNKVKKVKIAGDAFRKIEIAKGGLFGNEELIEQLICLIQKGVLDILKESNQPMIEAFSKQPLIGRLLNETLLELDLSHNLNIQDLDPQELFLRRQAIKDKLKTLNGRLLQSCKHHYFQKHKMIYQRANRGSNIYILLKGKVGLENNNVIFRGHHFGDELLKGSEKYSNDAYTLSECHLVSLNMHVIVSLKQQFIRAFRDVQVNYLTKFGVFSGWDPQGLQELSSLAHYQYYRNGQQVYHYGLTNGKLYFLIQGEVTIQKILLDDSNLNHRNFIKRVSSQEYKQSFNKVKQENKEQSIPIQSFVKIKSLIKKISIGGQMNMSITDRRQSIVNRNRNMRQQKSVHDKVFQKNIKDIYKKIKRRQFKEYILNNHQFFGEYEPFYLETRFRESSVKVSHDSSIIMSIELEQFKRLLGKYGNPEAFFEILSQRHQESNNNAETNNKVLDGQQRDLLDQAKPKIKRQLSDYNLIKHKINFTYEQG